MTFLDPIQDICQKFLVKIRLTNEYLFYHYFVRLSVGLGTKVNMYLQRNVKFSATI